MAKTAIVTDSNSGITQSEAKELGITVIPMPFTINGKTFLEDITLTQEQFYKHLGEDSDISTSQPSITDITDCWDSLLEEYDEIVHIPMSSGLSGSCQTALMLSDDYNGKVYVVNNQRISVTQKQSVLDAMKMAENGISGNRIKNHLEKTKFDSSIYITLETLKYLKKGGRITPAAAAMASLLKIKPILQIQGEKLDSFRFKTDKDNVWIHTVYSGTDTAECEEFKAELLNEFPNHSIETAPLSLSISCHIGAGALAVTCTKKLNLDEVE